MVIARIYSPQVINNFYNSTPIYFILPLYNNIYPGKIPLKPNLQPNNKNLHNFVASSKGLNKEHGIFRAVSFNKEFI